MAEAINSKESRNHWNLFLENINQSKEELGSQEVLWYRGQADYDYKLIPSLLRMKNGLSREKFLFQEYKRAAIWFQDKRETDWETLFDMQHYWIPTRLLDWTEVLGIAIAFAIIKQRQTEHDAAIFILNPKVLNGFSGLDGIKHVPGETGFEYQSVYWDNKPFAARYPIAIQTPYQNRRILAQRGVFTIHGANLETVEFQCPTAVKKIRLPKAAGFGAKEFLENANINEGTIYPDIYGMAQHIVERAAL